jgi:chromosome segregation ATPase
MTLGTQFKRLYGGLSDPTGKNLISRIEAAIPDPEQLGQDETKLDIKYKELEAKLARLEQEKQQLQSTLTEVFESDKERQKLLTQLKQQNQELRSQLATAQAKYDHARKLAEESLKLPANTGGKIKAKIREAFPELRDF